MHSGTVLWFSEEKGFGWILTENGQEVFVHYTSIQLKSEMRPMTSKRNLQPGQKVWFDLYESPKGQMARNVTAIA